VVQLASDSGASSALLLLIRVMIWLRLFSTTKIKCIAAARQMVIFDQVLTDKQVGYVVVRTPLMGDEPVAEAVQG
jgi:hypothetical protein